MVSLLPQSSQLLTCDSEEELCFPLCALFMYGHPIRPPVHITMLPGLYIYFKDKL